MSLAPSPWTDAALDPPGQVPLRGHRVGVAGEENERLPAAPCVEERLAVVVERAAAPTCSRT